MKKIIIISSVILLLILIVFIKQTSEDNNIKASEDYDATYDIKDYINDKEILKIIDIHENLSKYIDKEIKITANIYEFTDGFSLGKEYIIDNELVLFDIPINENVKFKLNDINNNDLVIVTGIIESIEEIHDGHIHNVPLLNINSIEKIK